jgi:hypothetical protein
MIDLHTHMTYFGTVRGHGRSTSPPAAGVTTVLAANARKTLETGVTTVRDHGGLGEIDYAMRDLINGKIRGRGCSSPPGLSAPRRRPTLTIASSRGPRGRRPTGRAGSRGSCGARHHADADVRGKKPRSTRRARRPSRGVPFMRPSGVKDAMRWRRF